MSTPSTRYRRHRFPPQIISHAVWLYHRFSLSFRDVEDLLAQRGVEVSYETIRRWCLKFAPSYAANGKRRQPRLGDIWHLDEVFVRISGRQQYLWRAVDQDGDVIDILVQARRDQRAAKRFLRKLVKGEGGEPIRLVTDKLRSYGPAHREIMPSVLHDTRQYANNRAEVSHLSARAGEGANSNKRAPDATLQVASPGAALPLATWHRPESVPIRPPSSACDQRSDVPRPGVLDLARGDVRLLSMTGGGTSLRQTCGRSPLT